MLATAFGTGQVFWSMLWFFLFFLWMWLVITVFADIFRSSDLSGWGKAAWSIFVIFLPYLGVFVYLIASGGKMSEHATEMANGRYAMAQSYGGNGGAAPPTDVDQLVQLASMKEQGLIDDDEYKRMKSRLTAA